MLLRRKVLLKKIINQPPTSSNPPEHSLDKSPQTNHVDSGDETDTTSYLSVDEDGPNQFRSAPKGPHPSELPLGPRSQTKPMRFTQASSFSSVQRSASRVVPKSAPLPTEHDPQHPLSSSFASEQRSLMERLKSKMSKSSWSATHSTPPTTQQRVRPVKSSISKPSLDTNASTPFPASEAFLSPRAPPPVSPESQRPAVDTYLSTSLVPLPLAHVAHPSPPAFPSPTVKAHPNSKPRLLAQPVLAQRSGQLKGVSQPADRQLGHPFPQAVASPSRFAAAKERNAMPPPVKTSTRPAATRERSAMSPPVKTFSRPAATKERNPVAPPVTNSSHSSAKNERLPMGLSMQTPSHLNARNERLLGGQSAITSPRAGIINERPHLKPLTTAFSQPYDVSSSSSPSSDSPVSFAPAFNVLEFIKNTRPNQSLSSPVNPEKLRQDTFFFHNDPQGVEKIKYHRNVSVMQEASVTNPACRKSTHVQLVQLKAPELMESREQRIVVAVTARGNDKQAGNTSRGLGLKRSHAVYASIRP